MASALFLVYGYRLLPCPHVAGRENSGLPLPPLLGGFGPTHITSFNHNYLLKVLSADTVTLGLELQHLNVGGTQFSVQPSGLVIQGGLHGVGALS